MSPLQSSSVYSHNKIANYIKIKVNEQYQMFGTNIPPKLSANMFINKSFTGLCEKNTINII